MTVSWVAVDGVPAGVMVVSDTLRPQAAAAVAALQKLGLHCAMLTGALSPTLSPRFLGYSLAIILHFYLPSSSGQHLGFTCIESCMLPGPYTLSLRPFLDFYSFYIQGITGEPQGLWLPLWA